MGRHASGGDGAPVRRAAVVVAAAVLAGAVVVAVALRSGEPGARAAGAPLRVTAALTPDRVFFGDPVTAELDVVFDPARVDPASLVLKTDFSPYAAQGAPSVERLRSGPVELARYRFSLLCVEAACLPAKGPLAVQFAPAQITAGSVGATASWKPLVVSGRVRTKDLPQTNPFEGASGLQLTGLPSFRRDVSVPPPAYRVAPGPLATWLAVAAGLLAAAAAALVALELVRVGGRRGGRVLSGLEAALAAVREAARRDSGDRRKALELLAEELKGSGRETLARTAAEAAWNEREPSSSDAVALADEVEQTVGTR
jgi:hypothetical protein